MIERGEGGHGVCVCARTVEVGVDVIHVHVVFVVEVVRVFTGVLQLLHLASSCPPPRCQHT